MIQLYTDYYTQIFHQYQLSCAFHKLIEINSTVNVQKRESVKNQTKMCHIFGKKVDHF